MKKRLLPFLVAIGLIFLVIIGFFAVKVVQKYTPSKEKVDINKIFNVTQDQVAVIFNEELQEVQGIYLEGQTYLPISWVNTYVNDRFYWDAVEKMLVYALPDRVVYADYKTKGSTGSPLIWVTDDQVYLSLGLIMNYTDIRIHAFDEGIVKRIFINNKWEAEQEAEARRSGEIRVEPGIKSPVITQVLKADQVKVIKTEEKWAKVMTQDGYIGYIQSRVLGDTREVTPVSSFEKPVYNSNSLGEEVSLVWHQVTTMEANKGLETLLKDTKGVNVISPTWFALTDNKGNYNSLASKEYVEKAHAMGLQVWALIDNFSKEVNTEILMASTSIRRKLINSLMDEVKAYELDGLNLDFEGIKEEAGVHYVQFIRELSIECRKQGVILSVDNYVPAAYNEFYNRKEQGIVADYVIIMGYDEHYAGGEPGSVASIGYVEKGISDTLKVVPKEKVINAMPFFTRVWTEDGDQVSSSAIGISNAKAWIEENQVELYWQEELGQYYGEINSEDGKKYFWMEEEDSLGLKMELIDKYDLAGAAFWKLGLESKEVWDIVQRKEP